MTTTPDNLEIEVKFFIADADRMRRRLAELGATARPRVFETNIRYEDRDDTLKAGGQLLRLRRDGSCRLTYKCPPALEDPECKVFQELEVAVGDFEAMAAILKALRFRPVQTYEKWRQTYIWRDVELCLDEMPYGSFVEVEGPKKSIKAAARHLDLEWADRILDNYLAIFELLRQKYALPFENVTFADFKRHPVDIVPLLPVLQAGWPRKNR